MPNPFTVTPANPNYGLQGVLGGIERGQQRDVLSQDKQMAEQKKQSLTAEAQRIMQGGNAMEMAQFSIANPEMGKRVNEASKFSNDATKASRLRAMTAIVSGSDPYQAIDSAIKEVVDNGGTPNQLMELRQKSPEEIQKVTPMAMATQFPAEFTAMQKARGADKYKQATGKGMEGWVMNEGTGKLSLSTEYRDFLLSDANKFSQMEKLDAPHIASINDKVTGLTKDVVAIKGAAHDLVGLEDSNSTSDQVAAVFKFMKALDPTSTVRESELGMVYSAEGAAQGFANMMNKLMGEGGLSEQGFQDIVRTSKTLANSAVDSNSEALNTYLNVIQDNMTPKQYNNMLKRMPSKFEIAKREAQLPPVNTQGWPIQIDAAGNKAYVGPNGEIEEVQ